MVAVFDAVAAVFDVVAAVFDAVAVVFDVAVVVFDVVVVVAAAVVALAVFSGEFSAEMDSSMSSSSSTNSPMSLSSLKRTFSSQLQGWINLQRHSNKVGDLLVCKLSKRGGGSQNFIHTL